MADLDPAGCAGDRITAHECQIFRCTSLDFSITSTSNENAIMQVPIRRARWRKQEGGVWNFAPKVVTNSTVLRGAALFGLNIQPYATCGGDSLSPSSTRSSRFRINPGQHQHQHRLRPARAKRIPTASMPPKFDLTVRSFTPPTLPVVDGEIDPSAIRSSHIPNVLSPTTSLYFAVSLPSARSNDPLYPATHLQMAYQYEGTGETISTNLITAKDIVSSGTEEEPLYTVEVPPESIHRVKVNHGESPCAEVRVRAWRDMKLLGMWPVGRIESLGLEGFKSQPIHLRRVEQWKATKAAAAAKSEGD